MLSFSAGDAVQRLLAIGCAGLLIIHGQVAPAQAPAAGRPPQPPAPGQLATPPGTGQPAATPAPGQPAVTATPDQSAKTLTPYQLDSLVAPIALYPDDLLSQVLVASTYPLEVVQAYRWQQQNSTLKGTELTNAVGKQTWDPSVQALVLFPDLLKRLDDDINWTADLGNAFLAQQSDVMDAVQRMRKKAQQSGKLKSDEHQKITTTTESSKSYVVIQPANPEVIYVPSYNPTVVWGAPLYYPYPPIYYPPIYYPTVSTGAVVATGIISFGAGMAMGAMMSGGWGCGWGHSSVYVNNTFINSNHFNNINRTNVSNKVSNWQHNPEHRGGVPYNNRNVSQRFDSGRLNSASRPTSAGAQQGLARSEGRLGNAGQGGGQGLGQNRGGQGLGQNRSRDGNFGSTYGGSGSGGGDRIGNRDVGGGGGYGNNRGAFGSANQSGSQARRSSDRGFSSGGGSRGGGGFRGGGGGGSRGGGGRRR